MRLLSLDYDPIYGNGNTRANFKGDIRAFDYDVVIWDPESSFETYHYSGFFQNLPSLSDDVSVQVMGDVARRRAEFVDFVNSGRTLVVIVRAPQMCYVDTGRRSYSGTGRNRQMTRHVEPFDLLSALPTSETKFTRASGTRINLSGDGPIIRLLRKYKDQFTYEAVMTKPPGTELARVHNTDRIVSSIQHTKNGGYLILLPAVNLVAPQVEDAEPDKDDDGYLSIAPEFQADLLEAIEQLSGSKVVSRPAWVERYATEEGLKLQDEVAKQQARVETARAKLAKIQQKKESAEAKDQLFLGSGRALELEVRAVLELLGGTVTEPEPGRDDWRVSFPEGDAVVEVKGVTKSAAEKHAAQLEKWVAGAIEDTGKAPKGILIVNTWRERPLAERTEEDFPSQMLPYCTSRGHCLMTGLQTFVMRVEVEKDPSKAEYWRRQILNTSGRLDGCNDWRTLIKESTSQEQA